MEDEQVEQARMAWQALQRFEATQQAIVDGKLYTYSGTTVDTKWRQLVMDLLGKIMALLDTQE